MKPKDIFKLALQILGLVFLYQGLTALPQLLIMLLTGPFAQSLFLLAMAGWSLLIAYWLLRGAPFLLRLAYPDTDVPAESERDATGKTAV